ncbi:MAG: PHP domain-containing protein [Candidatus Aenigmatarchaeota archaeon]
MTPEAKYFSKFELHCHSYYSKGSKIPTEGLPTPEEIIRRAKILGFAGVAITDHVTTKAWKRAKIEAKKQDIIFIPSVELQTNQGHMIALGISEPIKNYLDLDETIDLIHDLGGIAIAPHPFDLRNEGIGKLGFKTDAIEIFNALNLDLISNCISYKYFKKVSKSKKIGAVVGSDAHTIEMFGIAVNFMNAYNLDDVLKSIKNGDVYFKIKYVSLNEILKWVRCRLTFSREEVISYVNSHYSLPKKWLYKKMLKKFLATSDNPWRVLANISLQIIRLYSFLKYTSTH